jgi:hypothetical protein
LTSYAITDVLSSLAGSYDMAYTYNAQTDEWRTYTVGVPPGANTLITLNPGDGLWVHATASDTWTVTGEDRSITEVPLYTGWNLIAYPVTEAKSISDALSSIAGKSTALYTYDGTQQDPWLKYATGTPAWVSTLSQMTPGRGYWVKVNQNCTVVFVE